MLTLSSLESLPADDGQRNVLRILAVTAGSWNLDPTRCTVPRLVFPAPLRRLPYALRWAW